MSSTKTALPPLSGSDTTDLFFLDRADRLVAARRRAEWGACVRANRSVGGALRHAEQAEARGNLTLARVYFDQARRRAWVAARLLDRYDAP